MTDERFINDIDNGKLIDTKGELSTIYYSDKVDFYELWEFLNKLNDENEELKSKVKRYMEIELLKTEDANCYNCKHNRSVHDDVSLDGMCAIKGLMNIDGYFDTEYHKLPKGTLCPHWELEE